MIIFRLLGLLLLALGFVAFVVDGVKSIASASLVMTPLGVAWHQLDPASLNLVQALVQRYTFPLLWDPVLVTVLFAPSWLVFAVLGALLFYIGRHRAVPNAFTNER